MSQQEHTCADTVRQTDLSISHDLHVSFSSGEAQLDQLLLEGGVHVHSIRLLTLCLHSRQQQTVDSDENDAVMVWSGGSICLPTLCPHPRHHESMTRMIHFMSGQKNPFAFSHSV